MASPPKQNHVYRLGNISANLRIKCNSSTAFSCTWTPRQHARSVLPPPAHPCSARRPGRCSLFNTTFLSSDLISQAPSFTPAAQSPVDQSTNYVGGNNGSLPKPTVVSGKSFDRFIIVGFTFLTRRRLLQTHDRVLARFGWKILTFKPPTRP